ncbi:hypothetical protein LXL04_006494 [Taraxacum kok-saghyz]
MGEDGYLLRGNLSNTFSALAVSGRLNHNGSEQSIQQKIDRDEKSIEASLSPVSVHHHYRASSLIESLPCLEIISSHSSGLDQIDLLKCREKGIGTLLGRIRSSIAKRFEGFGCPICGSLIYDTFAPFD